MSRTRFASRPWVQALAAIVLIGMAVLVGLVLLELPMFLVDRITSELSPAERVDAIAHERRTVLAGLAGVGAGVSLFFTHLRHRLDRRRHDLDRDANATDRYTRAVEQLAHGSVAVRLGGIYALERLMHDSERDRGTVIEVLGAFVRDHMGRAVTIDEARDAGLENDVPVVGTDVRAVLVRARSKPSLG